MNKLSQEEQIARLKEALGHQKKENKNLKQQVKYAQESKTRLKDENRMLERERNEALKKKANLKKLLPTDFEQRIMNRFPDTAIANELLDFASNFTSELSVDSEQSPKP